VTDMRSVWARITRNIFIAYHLSSFSYVLSKARNSSLLDTPHADIPLSKSYTVLYCTVTGTPLSPEESTRPGQDCVKKAMLGKRHMTPSRRNKEPS